MYDACMKRFLPYAFAVLILGVSGFGAWNSMVARCETEAALYLPQAGSPADASQKGACVSAGVSVWSLKVGGIMCSNDMTSAECAAWTQGPGACSKNSFHPGKPCDDVWVP